MKRKQKMTITIGWLYPELMSTYGDRGNVIVLEKRCQWRGIDVDTMSIDFSTDTKSLQSCDLIFGGGAQDRQQELVIKDLSEKKKPALAKLFDAGVPGLFVCGAPQLLGEYYETGDGKRLEGLGLFSMYSRHFGKRKPRAIGNLVFEIDSRLRDFDTKHGASEKSHKSSRFAVGFENHGGRTYLHEGAQPLGRVIYGNGNNGEDGTEGAMYKNCIATYSHGPFLPKNPHIADWLIYTALEVKYKKNVALSSLDDSLEWQAHQYVVRRFPS